MIPGGASPYIPPFSASLAITLPKQYQMTQRGSTTGDIAITGTHAGILSGGIEASFNGGAYQTIVASPSGGTFSGTLTGQAVGQGTLTVRCVNSTSSLATQTVVGIGDVYVILGDSNHYGFADNAVQPTHASLVSVVFANDGTWKPHTEATSATGAFADPASSVYGTGTASAKGSYFGKLATLIMANGIPVAFIPQGIGSSTIDGWYDEGTSGSWPALGFNPNFSSGAMAMRLRDAANPALANTQPAGTYGHKAVLCELGTNGGAGSSQATYESELDAMVNHWFTHSGSDTVLCLGASAPSYAVTATQNIINSNAHALQGPDFQTTWAADGIHYLTTGSINAAAAAMYAALQALGYY